MATETEVKIRIDDPDAFAPVLARAAVERVAPRTFEDNFVLDFPDDRLRREGCLLRVRQSGGAALITYKGPAAPGTVFKIREELETAVQDSETTLEIFRRLGMDVRFRYQKYRTEYALEVPGRNCGAVRVAYDETPIGTYVELEGEEAAIRAAAAQLEFPQSAFLRDSYCTLYLEHCRRHALNPTHMTFRDSLRGQQ